MNCDKCGEEVFPENSIGESGIALDGYLVQLCDYCMVQTRMEVCLECNGWSPIDEMNGFKHKSIESCNKIREAAKVARDYETEQALIAIRDSYEDDMGWTVEQGLNNLAAAIHTQFVKNGFYEGGEKNFGEIIALCHSELSEALEAKRHGNPSSDKIPEYSGVEEELVDTIIRILDLAGYLGIDLDGALHAKMDYNVNRPYKHGKRF